MNNDLQEYIKKNYVQKSKIIDLLQQYEHMLADEGSKINLFTELKKLVEGEKEDGKQECKEF